MTPFKTTINRILSARQMLPDASISCYKQPKKRQLQTQ